MGDVIDTLAGIGLGSPLDILRTRRPEARTHSQTSYQTLFAPDDLADVAIVQRFAVAAFVAGLHGPSDGAKFYAAELSRVGGSELLSIAVAGEVASGFSHGPYGHYPVGPLSGESVDGPVWHAGARETLGAPLAAALDHAHMLVFHPRDSSPAHLQALLDAGWSTTGVVTISQLVAFLSYQLRVAAGLRTLAAVGVAT